MAATHLAAPQGRWAISLFRGEVEYPRSVRSDRTLGSAVVDTRSSLPQISYIGGTLEISLPVTSQFLLILCLQRMFVLSG